MVIIIVVTVTVMRDSFLGKPATVGLVVSMAQAGSVAFNLWLRL